MRNAISLFIIIALCYALPSTAQQTDSDTSAKSYFQAAKHEIEQMLDGKQKLSYERAIFLMENAFVGNQMQYDRYKEMLDLHTANISTIIAANVKKTQDGYQPTLYERLQQTPEVHKAALENLLKNWAIYKYMIDTTYFQEEGKTFGHVPYRYSYTDPLASNDWANTQVVHLLDTKRGNCFALTSLYMIFAERLQAKAQLRTAPSHIFITHEDEAGRPYNVELSNGLFPGSATIEVLTHTPDAAVDSDIAMRTLDRKQAVALCLVYLAKGYQHKLGSVDDAFLLQCAESALRYDDHNLNAMLLKAEILESRLIQQQKSIIQLQKEKEFVEYQHWIDHICQLGYREMPIDMKNLLVKGWTKDTITQLVLKNNNPPTYNHSGLQNTRTATLSWGLFDEEMKTKPIEQFGRTLFDTKTRKITKFIAASQLYNAYNFDPVAFAWQVDPLAHQFPHQSPYCAMDNNPILKNDPTGAAASASTDVKENSNGSYTVVGAQNDGDNNIYKVDANGKRTGDVVGQTLRPFDFMTTNDGDGSFDGFVPATFNPNHMGVNVTIPDLVGKNTIIPGATLTNASGNALVGKLTSMYQALVAPVYDDPLKMLTSLKVHSANGKELDIKSYAGAYTPVSYNGRITTMRAIGNIAFGQNMDYAQSHVPFLTKGYLYSKIMPEVGGYNQRSNHGNGYNAGFPFYGEHTYSGNYIYYGYFGSFPQQQQNQPATTTH